MTLSRETIDQYIRGEAIDPLNPNIKGAISTASQYAGNFNGYSEERNALHEQIIANHLEGVMPAGECQMIAVAGGMSVGMTYMKRLLENHGIVTSDKFVVMSPLSMLKVPEFSSRDHYQHAERSPLLNDEYFHIIGRILDSAYEKGLSVCLVDMGDDAKFMIDAAQKAKANNYATGIFGLTVKEDGYFTASDTWQRVFGRIADHPRGFRIMRDFTQNWDRYTEVFDDTILLETYYDQNERLHHGYIVSKTSRSAAGEISQAIIDPVRYQDFVMRAHLVEGHSVEEAISQYPEDSKIELPVSIIAETQPETELHNHISSLTDEGFSGRFADESKRKLEERRRRTEFREKGLTSLVGYFNRTAKGQEHGRQRCAAEMVQPFTIGSAFFEDRRRIESSPAWRRTKDINQFRPGTHFSVQNRLTHTTYAQNIGEMICTALNLGSESIDLTKAIVAAHDIGHAPFSHRGERVIEERLGQYGRAWDHDAAGLRVIHEWTNRNPEYKGLNLSVAVMEGLAKRFWRFSHNPKSKPDKNYFERSYQALPSSILEMDQERGLHLDKFNMAEGQIAALSDWIAFTGTDIEDGLLTGEFSVEELCADFAVGRQVYEHIRERFDGADFQDMDTSQRVIFARLFTESIQARLIQDLIEQTTKNIEKAYIADKLKTADDVRDLDHLVVSFSPKMQADLNALNDFNRDVVKRIPEDQKIPYREYIGEMIDAFLSGEIRMSNSWQGHFNQIQSRANDTDTIKADLMELIAQYMICEVTDSDVIDFISSARPQRYDEYIAKVQNQRSFVLSAV